MHVENSSKTYLNAVAKEHQKLHISVERGVHGGFFHQSWRVFSIPSAFLSIFEHFSEVSNFSEASNLLWRWNGAISAVQWILLQSVLWSFCNFHVLLHWFYRNCREIRKQGKRDLEEEFKNLETEIIIMLWKI